MGKPSKQKLVEEGLELQEVIEKATERLKKIKSIIGHDLKPGTYPIAGTNVQVKAGSKLFQKNEFEVKFPADKHPEFYAPAPSLPVIKESFAPIELDQFYKQGEPSVVIPKRKA